MTATSGQHPAPSTVTFASVSLGDTLGPLAFPLRRADLVRYAGASGDFNPIHWNQRFARAVGLPDVIAHGMLTMATAARLVTDWCGDPGAVVEYATKFTKPVLVPDDDHGAQLLVSGVVAGKDDTARTVRIDLTACSGPDGSEKVLGRAQIVVRLP